MSLPDGGARPVAPGRPAASSSALPRVVATDLDGTLLRSDGTVSERTRAALRAAEDAGVEVVFVTARPPRWLDQLADVVGG
ncbi:MAG: HAD family hydrolase, partial [Cellulosimicrobium cellulans]